MSQDKDELNQQMKRFEEYTKSAAEALVESLNRPSLQSLLCPWDDVRRSKRSKVRRKALRELKIKSKK